MAIHLGLRSILSLVGIVILIIGVWYVDRTWDEQGASAVERSKDKDLKPPVDLEAELDAALRFPLLFLGGWALFAISYFFPTDGGSSLTFSVTAVLAAISALVLSGVGSLPMADAVRHRRAKRKQILSLMFLLSWVALTVFTGLEAENTLETFIFAAAGMVSIVVAMMFLFAHRKMGTVWEKTGAPNPRPVVYNPGGPLFVLGWFLFWLAMASASPEAGDGYLLFDLNLRTAVAFIAGLGVVFAVFAVDYAHDEGAKYVGFGTDGSALGRLVETPIPFIAKWTLFGLVNFISPDNGFASPTIRSILILVICLVMGVFVGVFIQSAIYKADGPLMSMLSVGFVTLLALLAIAVSFAGGAAPYLIVLGVIMVAMSQRHLVQDRKRGNYWIANGEPNPSPIVYSAGALMFPAGWILSSWAISLPA